MICHQLIVPFSFEKTLRMMCGGLYPTLIHLLCTILPMLSESPGYTVPKVSGSFRSAHFGSFSVGGIPLLFLLLSKTPPTNVICLIASALEDDVAMFIHHL